MIRQKEIIAILDARGVKNLEITDVDEDIKSYIITSKQIYTSTIASTTLLKRSQLGLKVVNSLHDD